MNRYFFRVYFANSVEVMGVYGRNWHIAQKKLTRRYPKARRMDHLTFTDLDALCTEHQILSCASRELGIEALL